MFGEGEVVQGHRWYRSKERWWFPIGSLSGSVVTIALSLTIRQQFAIECLLRSNQQGSGSLWGKVWRGRAEVRSSRDWAVVCKRNHVDIFCRLNTKHERDRQTDDGTNDNIDRNSRNRLLVMSLKMTSLQVNRT